MSEKKKGSTPILIAVLVVVLAIVGILVLKPKTDDPTERGHSFYTPNSYMYTSNWNNQSNVEQEIAEDPAPVSGVRDKYTHILGNNKDVVTIMVYMCGSDLESQGSMATYDLSEMAKASISPNVNLIVYTGGCTKWHVDGISNKYNQIFKVEGDGKIYCVADNAGTGTMVDPNNLVSFIEFCEENYEANRYDLIFWDHGGGTVSGYGHDTKYPNAGTMTLDKIDQALTEADVKFDFVGFDACLMATTENGLMLAEHADYMIASEESEPGIGWYYTTWLSELSKNTSMPTVQIGKSIADSFVSTCKTQTPSQPATLSVVDLAELKATVPAKLSAFSKSTSDMLNDGKYKQVSSARGSSREFGTVCNADMVDLVDLAGKLDGTEARALKDALLGCIKYNNASKTMTNSYGLSIYFPYRTNQYVSSVLKTYDNIDMNTEYSDCIRNFASYQTSGQLTSGGSHSAYQSFGSYNPSSYYSSQGSADDILNLLNMFLGGSYSTQDNYSNYYSDSYNTLDWLFGGASSYGGYNNFASSFFGKSIPQYIADNHFDADLTWKNEKINLTKEQWDMVTDLKLNLFVDDGTGYIDLGKDNIYDIDNNGNLLKQEDLTWIAASVDQQNWEFVPYYYTSTFTDGDEVTYYGRIPAFVNNQLANLQVEINDDGMKIIGVSFAYDDTMAAKSLEKLNPGDTVKFVCDYYDYNGNFTNTYVLGKELTIVDQLYLGDMDISNEKTLVSYEFVDIYQQSYWTDAMK